MGGWVVSVGCIRAAMHHTCRGARLASYAQSIAVKRKSDIRQSLIRAVMLHRTQGSEHTSPQAFNRFSGDGPETLYRSVHHRYRRFGRRFA